MDAMVTWNISCFTYSALNYVGTAGKLTYPLEDGINLITSAATAESYLAEINYTVVEYTFLWLNWYVVEFDININPNVLWYTDSNETGITNPAYIGYYDLETAILHELGHALGLAHSTSEYYIDYNGVQHRNIMYHELLPQSAYRNPSYDEILGVMDRY